MNPKDLKDWITFGLTIAGLIVTGSIAWQKLVNKINGLGGRVKKTEDSCAQAGGRMDRFEKELAEYRRDAQDAIGRMGRVEKAVDDVHDEITEGNIVLGTQLSDLTKLINATNLKTSNKLVRLETLTQVEKKIGPLPVDE